MNDGRNNNCIRLTVCFSYAKRYFKKHLR